MDVLRASSFLKRQDGLVLYVAMMMLLVLSLLGIVGMQVASMQERMASNYYHADLAFQNAESAVRVTESAIEAQGDTYPVSGNQCVFDSLAWARAQTVNQAVYVRRLGCEAEDAPAKAQNQNGSDKYASSGVAPLYEITVLASDVKHGRASTSVLIQTTYLPKGVKERSDMRDQEASSGGLVDVADVFASGNKSLPYGRQSWRQLR